jgi:hypothetical protein
LLGLERFEQADQDGMLEDVSEVAGMKGVVVIHGRLPGTIGQL